jgi:hypothetical protein
VVLKNTWSLAKRDSLLDWGILTISLHILIPVLKEQCEPLYSSPLADICPSILLCSYDKVGVD